MNIMPKELLFSENILSISFSKFVLKFRIS